MSHGTTPDVLLWALLGAVVLPAWLLAGLCDYLLHARTGIEHTSGLHESLLHLLQTAQIGLPALAVLFLEVDGTVLALCALGVAAHTVTAWRDLRYTQPLRHVGVPEQFVHAFLIVLPFAALALLLVLHWPGPEGLQWTLRPKPAPFPPATIAAVLAACLALGVVPGAWEWLRCLRQARR